MIEFSFSFLLVAFGFLLTGHFVNFICFFSIIFIHELGHVFFARIFNVKVKKIIFYPYGGLSKFDYLINIDLYKEFFISIGGFVFQWIFYYIIFILYKNNIIREYVYIIFFNYHFSIFIFNVFPIIPLDGFKIVNIILSYFFSFNICNYICIFISFISIFGFIFFINGFNYSFVFILSVLFKNIYEYIFNLKYLYNRFLLERYLYDIKFYDKKIINNKKYFFRNKNHIIKDNNKYILESDFLNKIFKNKNN